MIYSTNSLNKAIIYLVTVFLCLSGCTAANDSAVKVLSDSAVPEKKLRIAALPIYNISGTAAPLKNIRQSLIDNLRREGLEVVDEKVLETFIIKHRIRYLGGIDSATARALRWETGAEAVLIIALELFSEGLPPKIVLTTRLVSTGNNPTILWMDAAGLAGNDSIGILELSLIEDPQKLVRNALHHLSTSLADYLSAPEQRIGSPEGSIRFWPRIYYRSPIFDPNAKYTVAITPFFNRSQTRSAGEIISLHFVRHLRAFGSFSIIEPGVVRQTFLDYRIIYADGISNAQADILFSKLNVDLILAGKIFSYEDSRGPIGIPKLDFSAMLIERKSREVVWASESHGEGDDGVFFFDWGKINTAHRLASLMVASALSTLVE